MYTATTEGMQRGYWKVINTETGETVRVVTTAAVADQIAETLTRENGEHVSGHTRDMGGRLPMATDFKR